MEHNGTGLLCSCCGKELLGIIRPGEHLEIKDSRHGQSHVVVVSPVEVLSRLAGTSGKEAILKYVTGVLC